MTFNIPSRLVARNPYAAGAISFPPSVQLGHDQCTSLAPFLRCSALTPTQVSMPAFASPISYNVVFRFALERLPALPCLPARCPHNCPPTEASCSPSLVNQALEAFARFALLDDSRRAIAQAVP